jgi:hypothetical protein
VLFKEKLDDANAFLLQAGLPGEKVKRNGHSLEKLSEHLLLCQYIDIIEELHRRGVVRTNNNPVSDYGEWLVWQKLNLTLATNSKKGYDAMDKNGIKYEIKSRKLTTKNGSRQLGVIRNLELHQFDFLIGLIFNNMFEMVEAYKIPHGIIKKYATFSDHQHGHIVQLRGKLLEDKRTENILKYFK